jgi:maleate isomerase
MGVVTPSTNSTLEVDCHDARPTGVTVHTARIPIQNRKIASDAAYDEHVKAMRAGIGEAVSRVMTCSPDHLIMGVALEAFWGGVAGSRQLQADLEAEAGVPVSIGSNALSQALDTLKVRRISVLTPHMPAGDEQVRGWLEEAGYDICAFQGLKCQSPTLIAEVTVEQMRESIAALNVEHCEAIVQVGTNLQFARLAPAAEQMLGKPVLALNSVMCWQALRHHSINDAMPGLGVLFEHH